MRLVTMRATEVRGVGTVEVGPLPGGVVALVVPDGRMRRALHQLVAGEGGEGVERVTTPSGADPALARLPPEVVARLHSGLDLDDLQAIVEAGTVVLAHLAGADRVEAARARLARLQGGAAADGPLREELLARLRALEGAPAELRQLEEDLRGLRAADIELTGDVEQARMRWLRERQDAETRLQAYRDRARELRETLRTMDEATSETPCPTCGRPLHDHYPQLRATLGEEWEDLVQDGIWWRRRREQLEFKPDDVQDVERRLLHLRAEAQALEERVRAARSRCEELDEVTERLEGGPGGMRPRGEGGMPDGVARAVDHALATLGRRIPEEARRRLLDRAAAYLLHLTQGRLLGFRESPSGRVALVGPRADLPYPPDEDAAAGQLALRLAAVVLLHEDTGATDSSMIVADAFDRLDDTVKVRAVGLLAEACEGALAQILLLTRGEVVDRIPERLDLVLEFRADEGGTSFRPLGARPGRIRLATTPGSTRPPRGRAAAPSGESPPPG